MPFAFTNMMKKYFSTPVVFCFLLFLVFPVCVSYQLMDAFVTPRVILIAATVLVLVLITFFQSPINIDALKNVAVYALLIFLLLYAFSIFKSINSGDAWFEWMKSFAGFSVLFISAQLFVKEESRKTLLKFSQVSVLILSTVYCYQWIYFLKHQKLDFVFDLKLHIASTLGNKNFYGEVVCLLFPMSVISFFSFDKKWKTLSAVNIVILITTILLTQSFAVMAAFFVAVVIVCAAFYLTQPARTVSNLKLISASAIVLLVLCLGIYKSGAIKDLGQRVSTVQHYIQNPELIDSTTRANSNSTFERVMLWRNSISLIKENPITGCGASNWKLLYPKYGIGGTRYIEDGNVHYEHPHNDYLLIAAESGIFTLIAFLLFLFSLLWISIRELKRSHVNRLWFAAILFAVICFFIISIFSFPRMRFYGWILLSIYSGILFSFSSEEKKFSVQQFRLINKGTIALITGISLWTLIAGIIRYTNEVHSKGVQLAKKQQNYPRVVREAEKASSFYFPIDETATPFTWYKGMALFYSNKVENAKVEYEDAILKNPYHIQLLNDLATSYEQSNEREKAVELYQRALMVTPQFPHSLLNISACYFNMGKIDSAYFYIDKVFGIKLSGQEKKSYDVFLPAILHGKIIADAKTFPDDSKAKMTEAANDAELFTSVYRQSKQENIPFTKMLNDSLEARKK